jgi:gliding motility-associated-like protein
MKQNLFYLFLFSSFYSFNVRGQGIGPEIVNSTGGSATHLTITYEWNIGELALVESMLGGEYILTNGQLQSQKTKMNPILENFFIVPNNILSANGDGENDTWSIQNLNKYPENEVRVYDRNYRQVFYSKNYQNNWDGKLSENILPEDAYYFIIKIKNGVNTEIKKGFLTIIK